MTFTEISGVVADEILDVGPDAATIMVSVIRGDGGVRTVSVTAVDSEDRPTGHRYFTVQTGLLPLGILTAIVLPGYRRRFGDTGVRVAAATYRKEES